METLLRVFGRSICLFAFLTAVSARAQVTNHSGTISSPETWAAGTHYITGDVTVTSTLTVEAGAVVKFAPETYLFVTDGGTMSVDGEGGNEVFFTSRDDNAVGATVAGSDGAPASDDWGLIQVDGTGIAVFDHAWVRYGNTGLVVYTGTGTVTVSNSAFTNCVAGIGKYESNFSMTVRNTRIANNTNGISAFQTSLDLGTLGDPGNNVFRSNTNNLQYFNATTISAVYNDWGYTYDADIVASFQVFGGSATYSPWLYGYDLSGTAGADGADAGWRMLSAAVSGATRGDLADDVTFSTSSGNIFYTWDGAWSAGTDATSLTSGTGFVLYLFDDAVDPIDPTLTLNVPGTMLTSDVAVAVDAAQRYHLLGNPFYYSFDLSNLDLDPAFFQQVVSVWDPVAGSYATLTRGPDGDDAIGRWQGFFAERTTPGAGPSSLTFTFEAPPSLAPSVSGRTSGGASAGKQGSADEAFRRIGLQLDVVDAGGQTTATDAGTTVFFYEGAAPGWDAWDATKLPSLQQNVYVQAAFEGERAGQPVRKAQESLPLDPAGPLDLPLAVEARGVSGQAVFTWPRWENVPAAWQVRLLDTATGATVDLRTEDRYTFALAAETAAGPRFVLRIVPGAATDVEAAELPDRLVLEGNYPNPFAGATTIRYALPRQAQVRLVVYDLLGRRVETLVDGVLPAGVHQTVFRAGVQSPGVYVYRLEAGGAVRMGRMVLAH